MIRCILCHLFRSNEKTHITYVTQYSVQCYTDVVYTISSTCYRISWICYGSLLCQFIVLLSAPVDFTLPTSWLRWFFLHNVGLESLLTIKFYPSLVCLATSGFFRMPRGPSNFSINCNARLITKSDRVADFHVPIWRVGTRNNGDVRLESRVEITLRQPESRVKVSQYIRHTLIIRNAARALGIRRT
jgi:hypothetical protein